MELLLTLMGKSVGRRSGGRGRSCVSRSQTYDQYFQSNMGNLFTLSGWKFYFRGIYNLKEERSTKKWLRFLEWCRFSGVGMDSMRGGTLVPLISALLYPPRKEHRGSAIASHKFPMGYLWLFAIQMHEITYQMLQRQNNIFQEIVKILI